jgi:hypothetical protein
MLESCLQALRLLKITGQIMLRLYGVDSIPRPAKEQIVYSIESDLQDWVNHVPTFFRPNQENSDTNSYFYNIP